jgi:UrcA family protein
MKVLSIFALALALAAPAATFAASDDGGGVIQVRVSYGDVNLNTTKGATRLLQRLDGAATKVCGGRIISNPIDVEMARGSDCSRTTMENAVAQINAPVLRALYWRRVTTLAVNGR